jgi:hypothetical protein
MSYEDLDLRPSADEPPSAPPPARLSPAVPRALAAVLILAVVVTGYWVFRYRSAGGSVSDTAAPATAPVVERSPLGTEAEPIEVAPLDESDPVVRELMRKLSSHPSVVAWLATDDLIRAFTAVVSNIASGERATVHVPALKPRGAFQVDERGEDLVISSQSYARYLPLATAATSIDPGALARLYTTLKPRIEEAYRELGYPDTPFDQTLERAIVLLLATPIPSGPVPVEPDGGTGYRFAQPALEKLTPSQKLLIRFGPENARMVQTSLRNVALALGIPEARLP